eukprot:TRINITY_DN13561_c0_g1_i1.p1 TRINITY_DN13561_c0_g1~~TRINITY_DN13561_c0_g1_i1.p1  ORF type:complete len:385 (+),score=64.80 TRINITY_DN13561_c0_g1_i1:72-1226(+)
MPGLRKGSGVPRLALASCNRDTSPRRSCRSRRSAGDAELSFSMTSKMSPGEESVGTPYSSPRRSPTGDVSPRESARETLDATGTRRLGRSLELSMSTFQGDDLRQQLARASAERDAVTAELARLKAHWQEHMRAQEERLGESIAAMRRQVQGLRSENERLVDENGRLRKELGEAHKVGDQARCSTPAAPPQGAVAASERTGTNSRTCSELTLEGAPRRRSRQSLDSAPPRQEARGNARSVTPSPAARYNSGAPRRMASRGANSRSAHSGAPANTATATSPAIAPRPRRALSQGRHVSLQPVRGRHTAPQRPATSPTVCKSPTAASPAPALRQGSLGPDHATRAATSDGAATAQTRFRSQSAEARTAVGRASPALRHAVHIRYQS